MKALTLHQPWASLIAVGAKTIETRSWRTDYRGPLAIHAGKRAVVGDVGPYNVEDDTPRGCDKQYLLRGPIAWPYRLPLGAVVASCTLLDCVPITGPGDERPVYRPCVDRDEAGLSLWDGRSPLPLDIEDQAPFGDFSPGRFAWLLGDVKPTTERCPWCDGCGSGGWVEHRGYKMEADCPVCEGRGSCDPVPAKGRQGLWDLDLPMPARDSASVHADVCENSSEGVSGRADRLDSR